MDIGSKQDEQMDKENKLAKCVADGKDAEACGRVYGPQYGFGKIATPRDLAQLCTWKQIKRAYKYYYPRHYSDKLEEVFEQIRTADPELKPEHEDERLEINCLAGPDDRDEDMFYSCHTNLYSLSFRHWATLHNMPWSDMTLQHYRFSEILAHYIWEITWYGSEEESLKEGKELEKICEEIETGEVQTIPLSDYIKEHGKK